LATRGGKSEEQETFEEWDFADYPEDF